MKLIQAALNYLSQYNGNIDFAKSLSEEGPKLASNETGLDFPIWTDSNNYEHPCARIKVPNIKNANRKWNPNNQSFSIVVPRDNLPFIAKGHSIGECTRKNT